MVTNPNAYRTPSSPSTTARLADPHGALAPSDWAIRELIGSVDEVAAAMERKWGMDMLPRVVPAEWRQKFLAQVDKFDLAIASGSEVEVRVHGGAMIRAWQKLDAVATEIGILPTPPISRSPQPVEILGRLWTMAQLEQLVAGSPEVVAVLQGFPDATVKGVHKPPIDWSRGDDIPF